MKPIESSSLAARPGVLPGLQRRTAVAAMTLLALVFSVSPQANAQTAASPANATAVAIETQALSAVAIHPQREAAASVIARNESKLSAEVSGVLLRWTAEAGSTVKKGELLVEIDPTTSGWLSRRTGGARRLGRAPQAGRTATQTLAGAGRARLLLAGSADPARNRSRPDAQRTGVEPGATVDRSAAAGQDQPARAIRRPASSNAWRRPAKRSHRGMCSTSWPRSAPPRSAPTSPRPTSPGCGARAIGLRDAGPESYPCACCASAPRSRRRRARRKSACAFAAGRRRPVPPGSDGRLLWREAQRILPASLLVRRGSAIGVFVQQGSSARFIALPGAQEGRAAPVSLPATTRVVVGGQATLQDGAAIN
jgi:hypothetical protein